MIRILHSVSNMDRAGIETMLINYYRHIDRNKIQFDFLCNKKKIGAYDSEINDMGGRIFRTPGLNPLKFLKYMKYMKDLFIKHPEYKIVEAHNGALGVYALHAAKKNKIPVRIFHAHGASITKDLKLPLKLFCKSRLPYNMNKHFTCGIAAAECYFGEKVVKANDYLFVPNAIEVDRFTFSDETRELIRNQYNLADKHVIGHVGRFMAQKNHSFLIDVFAEIKKLDQKAFLVLLGDGELTETIKQKADELGLTESILFVGNVSNVNEWYNAFDVFVLPSIWEGLPVVGVEAQTADLPCVFSSNITKEIELSDRVAFLDLNSGVEAWAKKINEMLLYGERRNNAKLIAEKGYDIEVEAKKLQEYYLSLFDSIGE